jgi:hypothetical protein
MKTSLVALCLLVHATVRLAANDWTDRKEYDLVLTIRSESTPQKRLLLLDSWAKNYPKTSLARARQELFLSTYEALGDRAHMFDVSKQMLANQADDPVGLYWLTLLAPQQASSSPEVVDTGDKAAHRLLASVGSYFAADKKPAAVSDTEWQSQKLNVEVLAQRTIGWANWQRGNFSAATDDLSACLKKDPGSAEISSWLGIVSALDTNKQPQAVWYLARASNKELASPLPDDQRRQVNTMLEKIYASYHGSLDGLDELRKVSSSSAFPPPEFSIDPATVVNARRAEAELSLTNPELAAWLAMRRQLETPGGQNYFNGDLQGKPLPRLRGTVLHTTPPRLPREISLSMNDSAEVSVILQLSVAATRPIPQGAKVTFSGVAESFSASPFGLVVIVNQPIQVETGSKR